MNSMGEFQISAGEILSMLHSEPLDLPDAAVPWPSQGEWTYEDYQRLPNDGRRYEIVEGVLYVSPAPRFLHQYIIGALLAFFWNYVQERQMGVILPAPFEVHLTNRSKPLQPDLVFVRAENQPPIDALAFAGIPDLIVEVVSPSSLRVDRVVKFAAYEQAGVPEYWIVDPESRVVEVYTRQGDIYALHMHASGDQTISSPAFPDLSVQVNELFPPQP